MKTNAIVLAILLAAAEAAPAPQGALVKLLGQHLDGFLTGASKALIVPQKKLGKATPAGGPAAAINIQDTFLFKNKAYFELQRYVVDGLKLPTRAEFENRFPPAVLRPIFDGVRPTLYPTVEDTFSNILAHCTTFHMNTLGDMTKFASNVKHWSQDFATYYGNMAAVLTERAKQGIKEDQLPKLRAYLKFISNQAVKAQSQCDTIANNLKKFEADTTKDVDGLGKLSKDIGDTNPATKKMMDDYKASLETLVAEAAQAENEITDKYWEIYVRGPEYAWVFPIGTIVWGALTIQYKNDIVGLQALRDAKLHDATKIRKELASVMAVQQAILEIQLQMRGLNDNAKAALAQVTLAKNSFQVMKSDIDSLLQHYENADSLTVEDYFLSDAFGDEIRFAGYNWGNVSTIAKNFEGKALIEVVELDTPEKLAAARIEN